MPVQTPARQAEVLDAIVDYIFNRGVSDLSLRPLAEHLGTSPRMLLYYFDSRDHLLAEALAAARRRQYEMLGEWARAGATMPELLARYWQWAASDEARPYMRLFFEVFGLAVQGRPGTEDVLPAIVEQPTDLFMAALAQSTVPHDERREIVRLAIATLRGLLFDLLATGDRPPLDAAIGRFLAFVERQIAQ